MKVPAKQVASIQLRDPDGFYRKLIELHDGLDIDQSAALNAAIDSLDGESKWRRCHSR